MIVKVVKVVLFWIVNHFLPESLGHYLIFPRMKYSQFYLLWIGQACERMCRPYQAYQTELEQESFTFFTWQQNWCPCHPKNRYKNPQKDNCYLISFLCENPSSFYCYNSLPTKYHNVVKNSADIIKSSKTKLMPMPSEKPLGKPTKRQSFSFLFENPSSFYSSSFLPTKNQYVAKK